MAAGILAPGFALATLLRLGRDGLERWVLALALGRPLLAVATLLATSTFGAGALHAWSAFGVVVGVLLVVRRGRGRRHANQAPLPWLAITLGLGAAVLLVCSGVGRSGWEQGGDLLFFGHDTTNDPLVYAAVARALHQTGLPVVNPFAGGVAQTTSYLPFALWAGLHELGRLPMLDVVFRVAPLLETGGLALGALALVRALGAPPLAQALAPGLLLLGGEPSLWLLPLRSLGVDVQHVDTWAFFGPHLLAFNPIAAGLQTWFAALLLLIAAPASGRRAPALVAGLLIGLLFETKLFLWLPVFAALAGVALWRPPRAAARALRLAAAAAALGSLPSLLEKSLWAWRLRGADDTGFADCAGCLPRWLWNAALGDHDRSLRIFREADAGAGLDPGSWVAALGASAALALVALGARWLALPVLLRGARDETEPGAAVVHRVALAAGVLGIVGMAMLATRPHPLNAAQFGWAASFGWWPFVALAAARWARERRFAPLVLGALLLLPGSLDALWRIGFSAQPSFVTRAAERGLMVEFARVSSPRDVVFEPSMLENVERPSAVAWLAGRRVHLSLLSAVLPLPAAERERRFDQLLTVFVEGPADAALATLRESRAAWLYVPFGWQLPFDPSEVLPVALRGPAGAVYRVPDS